MRSRSWLCTAAGMAMSLQMVHAQVPCEADVARLCKDVPVGGGRIQACLKEHEAEVSEVCRKKIDELAGEVKLLAVVCRWDIGRLCSDVAAGAGRVAACLEQHRGDLSPECAHQFSEMKKQP